MGVVAELMMSRMSGAGQGDLLAAAERELAELRAGIEQHQAAAQRLAADWLHAASQDAAEQFDRQRREALRCVERDTARVPEFEARVVSATAEKRRHGLARHRAAIAAFVPKLVAAVEAAAQQQVAAVKLREAAVAELGESIVAGNIPHLAFNGILLPDLVAIWRHEVERMFNPPAAAAPRPVAVRAPKAAGAKPVIAPPAPRPTRAPRRDAPPEDPSQVQIHMLRNGVDLGDGTQSVVGDELTMMADQGRLLVLRGCADYLPKEKANAK
jgi:hypothetical protein